MPDFNKYAVQTPVQRPEEVAGLSQIVYPKYDYVNTFPPTADIDAGGKPQPDVAGFWQQDAQQLNQMFAGVPLAPGGVTPYNEARRYNNEQLGFLPGRDNEDLYAQNQGFLKSVGSGLGRLAGLTATKTGTGFGYLAGLVGIGNESQKYGHGFGAWVAGAGDNGIAKWFDNLENEKIKNDWLPIYKKASEADHGFFRHMGDLDFWTDDLTDGTAFMMSSFIPGMGISKLKLGANTLKGLTALRGIGRAEEVAALSSEGITGTVASQALEREGLGAAVESLGSKELGGTIQTGADATQQIPRAIKWIDNAKLARSIDVGTVSVINTASQAMYSANTAKNTAYDTMIEKKNADGSNAYTIEQAKETAAKVAKDSYVMNLGALSLMNLWEANFLFKKPLLSNQYGKGQFAVNGLFGEATLAKKAFGERAYSALKEPIKGFVTGGVWLGNMQLAIDRLNTNPDNFNLDFGDKFKEVAKQYARQSKDLLVGDDPEAAKALGLGGFIGAAAGKFLGHNELDQQKRSLENLNKQVNAFKDLGNIYKTDADGKLDLDNGTPVIDEAKIKSFVASMNNVLSLNQISKSFEGHSVPEMAKIYQDEVFARFAKSHFDSGLADVLTQKLSDVANIKSEDLALLGFDPSSKNETTPAVLDNYVKKAKSLQELYDNIKGNYVPADLDLNTKEGQAKYFDITDKMFYLSARSQSLSEVIRASEDRYNSVKSNQDAFNQSFNALSDETVTKYNELFEKSYAAGKQPYNYPDLYNSDQDYIRQNETRDQAKSELDKFAQENIEVLEKLKKDSRGRYMYEVANKNLLPSAKEMERQQIIQAEAGLSRNATMQVLSRLADPKFGVKYFDTVYSDEIKRHAAEADIYSDIAADPIQTEQDKALNNFYKNPADDLNKVESKVTEDDINKAYEQAVSDGKVENKTEIADFIAEKISKGQELTPHEETIRRVINKEVETNLQKRAKDTEIGELGSERRELIKRREFLEGRENRLVTEEVELDNINKQIKALEDQEKSKYEQYDVEDKIQQSNNIQPENREKYTDVLNQINRDKKRVVKLDDKYQVDGEDYRKVTSLIGDTITDEQRADPKTQAAVSIGNTIDSITKAYFDRSIGEEFKNSVSDRMSEETYDNVIKSLDKLKADLGKKGIEIVSSNVFVIDPALKVAGEIDLLGVDKNGNFKIYEIQARRSDIYRQYGKRGLGVKLRDIDGKRLSMYRNMFANQYGVIPDEIAVKVPFEVKYDKTNPNGFIENAKIRDEIRFTPLKNVEIKMKNGEPIRIGTKFTGVDMTRIFLDTFLPKEQGDKLKFLFRNVSVDTLLKGMKLTVREALPEFQTRYANQRKALDKEPTDFKVKKFLDFRNRDSQNNPREFDNLYSLVGNTEISLNYEGTPAGYLSPVQTLAYKDADGTFKILDENTDPQVYANVTGNSIDSFKEFQNVAASYKKFHTELTNKMLASPNKELTLSNEELSKLVDLKPSLGQLDLVTKGQTRPDLKDLVFNGVKVGNKSIPTIANIDANGNIKVLMEKTARRNGKIISKYQEVDRWANQNTDAIKAATVDRAGNKVTDNVAIVETPSGEYKIVSLKTKDTFEVNAYDDFVEDLGSRFTAATTKNVFKNENIMVVPKISDQSLNVGMKDQVVVSKVYPTEDVKTLENFKVNEQTHEANEVDSKIDSFFNNLTPEEKQDVEDLGLNSKQAIVDDIAQGGWNIDDYLNNLKNCK